MSYVPGGIENPAGAFGEPPYHLPTSAGASATQVNVKDYGATGDGTTDDSAAVQAAINAAPDYATVVFPKGGRYAVHGLTIDGRSNLVLYGPGAAIVKTGVVNNILTVGGTTACVNIAVIGLEIDGNSFIGGTALLFKQTKGIIIRDCYIHHTKKHAVQISSAATACSEVKIINNRFEFIGIGYAADNTFVPNSPDGCGIAWSSGAPTDITIQGNSFTDIKGAAAIYHNGGSRVNIIGNRIKSTGYRGIFCTGTITDTLIEANTITDCGALYESSLTPGSSLYGQGTNGIYTGSAPTTAGDCIVKGNRIARCGENGIEGKGVFTDNTIDTTGVAYTGFGSGIAKSGIFVVSNGVCSRNEIYNAGDIGINMFDTSSTGAVNITILGNLIVNPGTKGINLQQDTQGTANRVVISGNVFVQTTSAPTHGVHLRGTSGGSLGSNVAVSRNIFLGTWSTGTIVTAASGGGTNTSQSWDNTLGGTVVSPLTINTQTGTTYTFVASDADELVTFNNAAAITVTVPTNASVAFAVGSTISVATLGAGQVHIVGDTGVTVNATPGTYLRTQYSQATLTKIATDTWLLAGDLAS